MNDRTRLQRFGSFARITLGLAAMAASVHNARAEWTQTNGPIGGTLINIVGAPPQTLYGRVGNSIYRSNDAGSSWQSPAGAGLPVGVSAWPDVVIGTTVFTVVNTPTNFRDLYRSSDQGETWQHTTIAQAASNIQNIHGFNWDGRLLALVSRWSGLPSLLLVSDDLGETWDALALPNDQIQSITFQSKAMLASGSAIWRSDDGAQSWSLISDTIPGFDQWGLLGASDDVIIAKGGFGGMLMRSSNGGDTWTELSPAGLPGPLGTVIGQGALMLTASGTGIYQSSDGGLNWSKSPTAGLPDSAVSGLFALGEPTMLLAGSGDGLFISTDAGSSWSEVTTTFIGTQIARVGSAGGTLVAATNYGPPSYRSVDNGASWLEMTFFNGTETLSEIELSPSNILMGTSSKGIFRSLNGGASWTAQNAGLPTLGQNELGQTVFEPINAIVAHNGALFAGTGGALVFVPNGTDSCCSTLSGDGVYRSMNNGASWQRVSNGLPINMVVTGDTLLHPIQHIVSAGGALLAATPNNGLWRSTNMGASWSAVSAMPGQILAMTLHQGTVYVNSGSGLHTSNDGGVSWTAVNNQVAFTDLASLNGELCGAGNAGMFNPLGVHRSSDNGVSWSLSGEPMDNLFVLSIAAHGDTLIAGTLGSGVWQFDPTPAPIEGDITGDGLVDVDDLLAVINGWGGCAVPEDCDADVTGNGVVDVDDLLVVINHWS